MRLHVIQERFVRLETRPPGLATLQFLDDQRGSKGETADGGGV
jgi:hypothetical protein